MHFVVSIPIPWPRPFNITRILQSMTLKHLKSDQISSFSNFYQTADPNLPADVVQIVQPVSLEGFHSQLSSAPIEETTLHCKENNASIDLQFFLTN